MVEGTLTVAERQIMTQIDHTVWQSASVVASYLGRKDSRPFIHELIGTMLKVIQELCRPVDRFLDLGCGDGVLAKVILEQFPDATAVLADHSAPMLDAARKNFPESASFHLCTIDYSSRAWMLDVEEYAPFDLVVSGFSIHHQPDSRKRDLYAEIFELLAPGGMFVNLEHVASPTRRLADLWDGVRVDSLYQAEIEAGSDKSRDTIAKEYLERPERAANLFAEVETQCAWLRDIGYDDVDCFFKFLELALFGGCRPR